MTDLATQAGDAAPLPFQAQLDAVAPTLPGAGQPWAATLRREARDRFRTLGLPHRKIEAWKYTDVRSLAKRDYRPAPQAADGLSDGLRAVLASDRQEAGRIVFVNGHLRRDLSQLEGLPDGVSAMALADTLEAGDRLVADRLGQLVSVDDRPFHALNTGMMADGLVLHLAPRVVLDVPLNVVFLTEAAGDAASMVCPRVLVVAEPGSQAVIVERHAGVDGAHYFSAPVFEVDVADGARIAHYKLQQEGDQATHLATILARIGRDATYDNFVLSVGAELARNEIVTRFTGRGGDCRLSGGYMARAKQHLDTTTRIEHAVPDCRSREVYKGVLDDRARGVFQGKIVVSRDAQRTDGYQMNRALLLSRNAEIDSKPELEIYADDVKCSHGATAGEIDSDALFYMRARGIDEQAARNLLIEAFVLEVLDEIADPAVREDFAEVVMHWLDGHRND